MRGLSKDLKLSSTCPPLMQSDDLSSHRLGPLIGGAG